MTTRQWGRAKTSLKKYTSHFIRKVVCQRELETEQRLQHIDLSSPSGHRPVSFSFSWAAHPGAWGLSLSGTCSHSSIFSPTDLNYLTPGLYNNLTSNNFLRASQFALNSTPRQSRSPPDIPRPDAPVIYTGAFLLLTAWPGSICNNVDA